MSNQTDALAIPGHDALTFAPEGRQVTSLDLTTTRGKKLWVQAMNAECEKLSEHLGETLLVTDAVAHEVAIVSERTGEVSNCIRLVVVTHEGRCYQCVSAGAWESLRRLSVMTGPLPWPAGVPLIPKQRNMSGGRRMFYFDFDTTLDEPTAAAKPPKPKKGE